MMIKFLKELGRGMDKHSENSNRVRKYQEETNRTEQDSKINNIRERKKISSRLDDTQEWICEMEDRVVQIILAFVCFLSKKRNKLKMRILFKLFLGKHPAYKLSYSRGPRRRSKK